MGIPVSHSPDGVVESSCSVNVLCCGWQSYFKLGRFECVVHIG